MVTINELMIVSGQLLAFAINALMDAMFDDQSVWRWMLIVATIPAIALLHGHLLPARLTAVVRGARTAGRHQDGCWASAATRPRRPKSSTSSPSTPKRVTVGGQRRSDARPARLRLDAPAPVDRVRPGHGAAGDRHQHRELLRSDDPGVDWCGNQRVLVLTITVGVVGVGGTILGIYMLGYVNRQSVGDDGLHWSGGGPPDSRLMFLLPESQIRTYLILVGMLVVVFFVQTFIGTLIWLLLSEIFPMTIRGFAMGT